MPHPYRGSVSFPLYWIDDVHTYLSAGFGDKAMRNDKLDWDSPISKGYLSEDDEQRQLIQWCRTKPELQFLFHIPNENTAGIKWGIRNRQLGVKSGVPDLFLPIPTKGYHGLFIEMKTHIGQTSPNQDKWISALNGFGYLAVVAHGWEEAKQCILDYLNLQD